MSRYRFIIILRLNFRRQRLQFQFAARRLFQLLNLQLGLGQFVLANLRQLHALFVAGQQRFQRQIARFHRFDDGFELLQRFFKRNAGFGWGVG